MLSGVKGKYFTLGLELCGNSSACESELILTACVFWDMMMDSEI